MLWFLIISGSFCVFWVVCWLNIHRNYCRSIQYDLILVNSYLNYIKIIIHIINMEVILKSRLIVPIKPFNYSSTFLSHLFYNQSCASYKIDTVTVVSFRLSHLPPQSALPTYIIVWVLGFASDWIELILSYFVFLMLPFIENFRRFISSLLFFYFLLSYLKQTL